MSQSKIRWRKTQDEDGSNTWSSVSDLMSGLMIIFLFIAVVFMVQINQNSGGAIQAQQNVNKIMNEFIKTKKSVYDDLTLSFKDKKEEWGMTIEENGTVKFEEPNVLFADGSDELTPKFTEILNQFFPLYIDTIMNSEYKDKVKEIRIEGHTSSKWTANTPKIDAYFLNMELSQSRTRKTLNYVMTLPETQKYENWLRTHMTANGMSSSKVITDDHGNENEDKSRRVEFKIVMDSDEVLSDILKKGVNKESK